ncbi:uncharacterized protein I303_100414 [Kwoniella dejecticola CBS 10117]|uniref:Uncharacterized protein n=1 Tax=Kwoniella dejecticola CBS 10117 TaxID=1296121 RepID=A0A1A6AEU4_9TREE|nr:uncharacterized protein I303_00414 [Kwoniella dejecticola CBS 10117]OBR88597.1 hypothetical protein I303_00414 [Kwoniella dejecticola CBS 10117]
MHDHDWLEAPSSDRARSSPNGRPATPTPATTSSALLSWLPTTTSLKEKISNFQLDKAVQSSTKAVNSAFNSAAVKSATNLVKDALSASSAALQSALETSSPASAAGYNSTFLSENEIDVYRPHTNQLEDLMRRFNTRTGTWQYTKHERLGPEADSAERTNMIAAATDTGTERWQAYKLDLSAHTYTARSEAIRYTLRAVPERLLCSDCECGGPMVNIGSDQDAAEYLKGERWFYSKVTQDGRRKFARMEHQREIEISTQAKFSIAPDRCDLGHDDYSCLPHDGFEVAEVEGATYQS